MKSETNFILGMLTGMAVGLTVSLFLAPSSGEQLRGRIQEQIHSVQDEMKLAAEERRAELEQQLAQLRAPRKSTVE